MNVLLKLPVELRLYVCSFIITVDPLTVPSKEYSGLLFCCKAIRTELEPEVCKRIAKSIHGISARIRNNGDEIIYTPPTTLFGWRNLTVSRPRMPNMFAKKDPFLSFKYFHFDTFTVTFHDCVECENAKRPKFMFHQASTNLAREIGQWHPFEEYPAMKRWRLDWRAFPQSPTGFGVELALREAGRHAWEVEKWLDEQDVLTGVCFYKRPKATRREKCRR